MIKLFDDLLSHLNAEDNETALKFRAKLAAMEERLEKLDALEAGGVDNWSGYGDCFEEFEEDE